MHDLFAHGQHAAAAGIVDLSVYHHNAGVLRLVVHIINPRLDPDAHACFLRLQDMAEHLFHPLYYLLIFQPCHADHEMIV